jgi:hypothetical protein
MTPCERGSMDVTGIRDASIQIGPVSSDKEPGQLSKSFFDYSTEV